MPSDREIVRAVNAGTPILIARPHCEASKAFRKLAQQVAQEDGVTILSTTKRGGRWGRTGPRATQPAI